VGDWIVGLTPKATGNRVVYAMRIDEILLFDHYYRDERFAAKIPDFDMGEIVCKCGDNIYEPLPNGGFQQLQSMHSKNKGPEEDPKTKKLDLGGKNVLISQNFHYFGSQGHELPDNLSELKVGRAHKNKFSQEVISRFLQFIATHPKGISGPPTKWPNNDLSWRPGKS
jgi:hypothetical protein